MHEYFRKMVQGLETDIVKVNVEKNKISFKDMVIGFSFGNVEKLQGLKPDYYYSNDDSVRKYLSRRRRECFQEISDIIYKNFLLRAAKADPAIFVEKVWNIKLTEQQKELTRLFMTLPDPITKSEVIGRGKDAKTLCFDDAAGQSFK